MNPGRIYPRGGVAPPLERKNVAKQKGKKLGKSKTENTNNMAKQKEEKHKECGKTKRKETRKEQNRTVGSDMNCRTVKLFAVEKEDGVVRSTLQHVTK